MNTYQSIPHIGVCIDKRVLPPVHVRVDSELTTLKGIIDNITDLFSNRVLANTRKVPERIVSRGIWKNV